MADLKVDKAVLVDSARTLQAIQTEFENAVRDRNDRQDIWGHSTVERSMSEFVHDWRSARGKLTEKIGKLRESMDKCAKTFDETEAGLKKSLEPGSG